MKTNPRLKSAASDLRAEDAPVAIIGMASIFPQASNLAEYWQNILDKVDCVTEVPPSRWSSQDYYDPDPAAPDKTYCKRGGFIPDIDFDPLEFGLPPNILEVTDVAQLLGLVVARDALEDAGYGSGKEFPRERTGVILGVVGMSLKLYTPLMSRLQYPIWEKVLKGSGIPDDDVQRIIEKIKLAYVGWEENSFPGTIGNVITGRIANRFDLGGANCVVDAACASSLAAVRMAVNELQQGQADMMITGGVDTDNSIGAYLCFSKTPAFSKGDRVRPFDIESDGMMVGEGLGLLVLKRLADAERDGDRIYAVIKGIGASSDGRFKSIYAPRSAGQAAALRRAYQAAGFPPAEVGLIEAHGTGTMAGDPAEFEGLREVFSENNPNRQHIALGSVKSQVAHTKAAAGAAGLIKAALALHHKVLPPTINVNRPNPVFEIESSPFYLNTETRPWARPAGGAPRRAGVSSFGFGGTNFHVVLEEYQPEHEKPYRRHAIPRSVLLEAETSQDLLRLGGEVLGRLESAGGEEYLNELAAGSSKDAAILASSARLGFVAASLEEARQALRQALERMRTGPEDEAWELPQGVYYRRRAADPQSRVVALFPGQGSQYVEMGRELAVNFPPLRQVFSAVDEIFAKEGGKPLTQVVYPLPAFAAADKERQSQELQRTENAQPAIGALSAGLYKLLQAAGFKPDFIAGHSFGELTALWAAGVFSDRDYLTLAAARGRAMAPPSDPDFDAGAMLAVKGDSAQVREAIRAFPEVTLANWNSNEQVVLAGSKAAIAEAQQALAGQGFSVVLLPVSAAFHTPLVGHAQKPFAKALARAALHPPETSVYSNASGKPYPAEVEALRKTLAEHMLNPVLFKEQIENIYAAGGSIFVEFGPKNVLTNLVKNILGGRPHLAVALNANPKKDSDRQLREAVMQLRVAGLPLADFDPYQEPPKPAREARKGGMTVRLNGGSYVSEKTRAAFENALDDGWQVSLGKTTQAALQPQQPPPIQVKTSAPAASSGLAPALDGFQAHQSETLRVHEQYLKNEGEYVRLVSQFMQSQIALLNHPGAGAGELEKITAALGSLEQGLARLQAHQGETLRVHEAYLNGQAQFGRDFVRLIEQGLGGGSSGGDVSEQPAVSLAQHPLPEMPAYSPSAAASDIAQPAAPAGNGNGKKPAPVAGDAHPAALRAQESEQSAAAPAGLDAETISAALLEIVSEKTGYPAETLGLEMDMEADLGIDSIKRVEILGAMQTRFPKLPKVESEMLAELRTLGQIIELMGSGAAGEWAGQAVETSALPSSVPTPALQSPAQALPAPAGLDVETISAALLEIVSEKTGYPAETLGLEMDMEADLGIDSIKRVEILGAMQARFPELPKVESEALAELRTLGQIIELMGSGAAGEWAGGRQQPAEASAEKGAAGQEVGRGVVTHKLLPPPDALQFTPPADGVCLLTDDGSPLTALLAGALTARGWKVTVLSFPEQVLAASAALPAAVQRLRLDEMSEEHLQARLDEIRRQAGRIAAFIHLNPVEAAAANGEVHFSERMKAILKHVFLLAKHLKPDLQSDGKDARSAFMAVARLDGEFGLSRNGSYEPVSGGLFGLVKTLNLEWDAVFCRAVDLSPQIDDAQAAQLLVAELYDPNLLLVEVGYSGRGRLTLAVEPAPAGEAAG